MPTYLSCAAAFYRDHIYIVGLLPALDMGMCKLPDGVQTCRSSFHIHISQVAVPHIWMGKLLGQHATM